MYTQCPDCDTAFRVTARDLQRDSGRVVCMRCSREFSALERLSEDSPAAADRADEKRAILESLKELTGPHEIRIEDTGIEWRVIEEDELAEEEPPPADSEPGKDADSSIRWYIADLADELASEDTTGPDRSAAQTREAEPRDGPEMPEPTVSALPEPPSGNRPMSNLRESLELPATAPDEGVQRYDDNTPLPEDFVDEGEPRLPQRRAEDRVEPRSPEADEAQVDLGLGEPEEWMELLGEVGPASDDAISPSAIRAPADEALPDVDALADTDVRPASSGGLSNDELPLDDGYPSDIDTQFDLQAIELGIDLSGSRNPSLEHEAEGSDEPLRLAPDGPEGDVREQDLATAKALPDEEPLPAAAPAVIAIEDKPVRAALVEAGEWPSPPESMATQPAEDAKERNREETFELELEAAYSITPDDEVDHGPDDAAPTKVPRATEEEMTINRMIDQDLIRLAEQQNVFTSTAARRKPDAAPHVETIIMEGESVRSILDGDEESPGDSAGAGAFAKPGGRMPVERDDEGLLLQTYSTSTNRVRRGRRGTAPVSYSVMAGVAALGLVLAAQVVHAYRDTLATYPIFESTLGSVYRLLGAPVVPGWNVTEWRFEATSGSTDDTDEVLTISSRIANGSARPLPYPLLHVSLTDRWEEIIGSKVLEPAEYLTGSADPATRVSPGEKFTATVRVEAPAPEATGFKLNVCYPDSGDRVRCATEDFRD